MSKGNKPNSGSSSSTTTTKLPGINNAQVITSSPNVIKENSSNIKKR